MRAWRAANPERQAALGRKWLEENRARAREKRRLLKKRYRAEKRPWLVAARRLERKVREHRQRANGGGATPGELALLWKAQRGRCAYCAEKLLRVGAHLDHILPIAAGGRSDARNLQWTCAPCNLAKGAKRPEEFAAEIGKLL